MYLRVRCAPDDRVEVFILSKVVKNVRLKNPETYICILTLSLIDLAFAYLEVWW